MALQMLGEAFPPAPQWTEQDVPDMSGKVAAVTGGYGGIGYYTTKALLERNAKVYILGRNEQLFNAAVERLAAEQPPVANKPHFIHLDLTHLRSPLTAASELASKESKLDVLFCSAGVMVPPAGSKTDEGYELQWHTNVMGHFQLVRALLPLLEKVAEESGGRDKARMVHTSSSGHRLAPQDSVDWDSLKVGEDGNVGHGLNRWTLYGQSKLGNVIVANELNRRYGDKIISTSCNPGNLKTDLPRYLRQSFFVRCFAWVEPLVTYPAAMGALTQLYLGTAPDVKGGQYGIPWARIGAARADAADEELGRKVWDWLERECKVDG
ncbi:short-chain alcohol dehydrogenase [Naganishia albida]|nr:short-chain alcohol dehydrogenase [Naganishia albida]